jgi:hypothetical protein
MKKITKLSIFCLALLGVAIPVYSRFSGGSFFGGMAAGGVLGGLVGNSIGKNNARREEAVYYQQPVQERVVYVNPANSYRSPQNTQVDDLRRQNQELQQRLNRLESQMPRQAY